MNRCPKDESRAKKLVSNEISPPSEDKLEPSPPPSGHQWVKKASKCTLFRSKHRLVPEHKFLRNTRLQGHVHTPLIDPT